MKNFIYILFLVILNSCVTSKEVQVNFDKENIVEIDTNFVDSSFVDPIVEPFVDPIRKITIEQDSIHEIKYIVNEKKDLPKVEKLKTDDKVKVEVVDNTTLDDIKNESVGIMAYSTPEQMVVGKSYTIKLRISKEKNKIQLISGDRNITINDVTIDSKVVIESIRVEPIMSANLISEDGKFIIKTLSTETQNIEDKGYTEWEWRIIPLKGGKNFLKLVVKVKIVDKNGESYKDITVFDKNVEIKSNIFFNIKTWISNYWQWLITTIIIPFVIWFYKKKNEEKKKGKKRS